MGFFVIYDIYNSMKNLFIISEEEKSRILEKHENATKNQYLQENEVEEGFFDGIKDIYRGVKGAKRGFGMDYFQNMSRLENLIKKLKQLDTPNEKVMIELEELKNKVSGLGMPQARKDALVALIDNSLYHFKNYSHINDQILSQIKTLNLDSWK
jgi:hypothetical protein